MVRFFQRFIPDFLKRIDQRLLLNAPFLWATRIHFVLFYGSILALGLFGLTLTHEVSLHDVPDPDNWAWLAAIPLALAFGIWVFFSAKFQAIKSYGKLNPFHPMRNQLLFGLGTLAVVGIPMLIGNTMIQRMSQLQSEAAFEADLKLVSHSYAFFERSLQDASGYGLTNLNPGYWPDYETELWSEDTSTAEQLKRIEALIEVLEKYSGKTYAFSAQKLLTASQYEHERVAISGLHEDFSRIEHNLQQLYDASKKRTDIQDNDAWTFLMIISTLLFLASQVFMSTSWKTFAFMLLGGAAWGVMMVVSTSIMESMGMYDDTYIFSLVLLSLGFFLYQGYRRTHTQRSAQWKAIALGIATAMMPFAPVFLADILINHIGAPFVQQLLFTGCLGTIIAWNVALRPRFLQLHSQPKEN
ncbi:MAG: hypothetical protein AAF399_13550 [Bacteroidota bacterium]